MIRKLRPGERPWSPEEEARLDNLWAKGYSAARIGEMLNRTRNGVVSNRRKRGLIGDRGPPTHTAVRKERAPSIIKTKEEAPSRYLKILAIEQADLEEKKQRLREMREAAGMASLHTPQDQSSDM